MQNHRLIKRAKLAAVIMMAAFIYSFLPSQETGASAMQGQPQSQIDIAGRGTSLNERVAPDDGVAFAIHFSGDMHGNLDACG